MKATKLIKIDLIPSKYNYYTIDCYKKKGTPNNLENAILFMVQALKGGLTNCYVLNICYCRYLNVLLNG